MLALALVVVGGMALVNALTSEAEKPVPTPSAGEGTGSGKESDAPTPRRSGASATQGNSLMVEVIGSQPVNVVVKIAGSNDILLSGPLNPGEGRQWTESPLDVVASDGGALKVTIYGEVQERGQPGQRGTWFVRKR
ncbi:hypothetical protein ACFVH6_44135 [Spirillospora sp. NPDC127200]